MLIWRDYKIYCTMGALETINHLLNFGAPAAALAVALPLLARVLFATNAPSRPLILQAAVNFAACSAALVGGLWLSGRDGTMATYAAMALAGATSQWLMQGGWKA